MAEVKKFDIKFENVKKLNKELSVAKAYIAYPGKNRNGSYFSKEKLDEMLPSLVGIPVVGEFIEKEEDFGGHGGKIVIDDQGIKYVQTTKPYGYVPEKNNARWEEVVEENGTTREYLVADIILWTGRYDELNVVAENGANQSMEISVYEWHDDEELGFVVDNAEFSALCILGLNTEPCFESASVSMMNYSLEEDFMTEFQELLTKAKEFAIEFNAEEKVEEEVDFMLTAREKFQAFEDALMRKFDTWVWVYDYDETKVFYKDWMQEAQEYEFFMSSYAISEDDIIEIMDDREVGKNKILTKEEQDLIEQQRMELQDKIKVLQSDLEKQTNEFEKEKEELKTQISELSVFKAQIEAIEEEAEREAFAEARQALVDEFAEKLEEDEIESFTKECKTNEELEDKMLLAWAKKNRTKKTVKKEEKTFKAKTTKTVEMTDGKSITDMVNDLLSANQR